MTESSDPSRPSAEGLAMDPSRNVFVQRAVRAAQSCSCPASDASPATQRSAM
jgi:hypothetical protein